MATPPVWNVRMVSCVPGSPMDWAAMMPDGQALFDQLAGGQVLPVAARTDALLGFTGQAGADHNGVDAQALDLQRGFIGDQLVLGDDQFVGDRVTDRLAGGPADDALAERHVDLFTLIERTLGDTLFGATAMLADEHVLCDVGEFTGEVA